MRRISVFVIVFAVGFYGYFKYQDHLKAQRSLAAEFESSEPRTVHTPAPKAGDSTGTFRCDGRIYCSQMTSCVEATFFLKNCPGTKMDGDNDGIPCESQWCK